MKILQLSTFDSRFGASIAARRLHESFLAAGQDCNLLVREVAGDAPRTHASHHGLAKFNARVRHHIDKLPLQLYPNRTRFTFSCNWVPSGIPSRVREFHSDIVHLHWCQSNFIPTPNLPQLGRPLIWTFHDMWAFTGGCHYTGGCDRYHTGCGHCPVLNSKSEIDLSHWLWQQKRRTYAKLAGSLQVICPSHWLSDVARRAPLLEGIPVHTVPNPINTAIFKPLDRKAARAHFGFPPEGPLLLMGATVKDDRRKGFDLLDEALRHYSADPGAEPLGVVTLGLPPGADLAPYSKLRHWSLGFLQNESSLAALYNAVDVVALPSREENLSNVLAEALCCGTPCLAFAIGGNGDLISHQQNGFLAQAEDTRDMAAGLDWILRHLREPQRPAISTAAQAKLSPEQLVPVFLDIYRAALDGRFAAPPRRAVTGGLELITHDPGRYHVSLDTVWEFEKTILADSRVRAWSSQTTPFSSLPNLFWRNLFNVWPPPKRPASSNGRDLLAVMMGPNIRKAMPRFLLPGRKSVYLFDAWPATHDKIRGFAEGCRLDHLFLTSSQASKTLGGILPETTCHWIPEGINPDNYQAAKNKDIDVLQLGRRYDRYHHLIVDPLAAAGKTYRYEIRPGQIIFPTRGEYLDGLARAKISICVPATLTHPAIAGGIETMTVRYLQSMLSRCLIVGHAPAETIELFGYNPVIEIDFKDPAGQLLSILEHLGDYAALVEKNYRTVIEHHTWRHRWEAIARLLWPRES